MRLPLLGGETTAHQSIVCTNIITQLSAVADKGGQDGTVRI